MTGPTTTTTGSGWTSGGANNAVRAAAGAYTSANATTVPTAASWTTETLALRALSNQGIAIARPNPAADNFEIVTVTASGLASGASICAPSDGTWTELGGSTITSGAVSQASFFSIRSNTNAESYTFNFQTGACPSGGSPTGASATAVAVGFSGVNPITPIDYNSTGTALRTLPRPRRRMPRGRRSIRPG